MSGSLRVGVQMDPIETVNINADSTFAMMIEAQKRGHKLWHYEVRHMALRGQRLTARAHEVTLRREIGNHFTYGELAEIDLGDMDVILMRQDPPFDMAYISATHMLEHIHPRTLVVNDPAQVRNAPEKLLVAHFPELMPPTLITWDREAIRSFRTEFHDIIIKPLFGNGGVGVFRLKEDDENFGSLLDSHFSRSTEPLMIQRYEPAVRLGDKRIILVDGEPMGAVNRVPASGDARSNMHVGGRAEKSVITPREHEICARIGPYLKEHGLLFVGIDVIGDYLTEINVTSPTGLQEITRFDGIKIEETIWNRIEAKVIPR